MSIHIRNIRISLKTKTFNLYINIKRIYDDLKFNFRIALSPAVTYATVYHFRKPGL